ncbi:MAG: hypothetical protein WDZ60_09530, partial [Wenzhouxiangellaceae bacterium]
IGVGTNAIDESTDSLLTLTNHANVPVAVKVRVIELQGAEAASFNIYLGGGDAFAAALSVDADDPGQAELLTRDGSCVIPGLEAFEGSDLQRLTLSGIAEGGIIEIIEMGRAAPDSGLVRHSEDPRSDLDQWIDCATLTARFDGAWQTDPADGLLPPSGNLSADVQLLDVFAGADASFAATAIGGFSDIVQHTPPGAEAPSLATAHATDTDSGTTMSRVCTRSSCRDFEWDHPIDAVASVLTTRALFGEVVVNPGIGAATELVITHPLARFNVDSGSGATAEPRLWLHDRDGAPVVPAGAPPLSPPPPKGTPVALPPAGPGETLQVFPFSAEQGGGFSPSGGSALLGLPVAEAFSLDGTGAVAARAEIEFVQTAEKMLVSRGGYVFEGLPVIGFIVRQFANGTLEFPADSGQRVLANYRASELMSRRRAVRRLNP